MSKCQICHIEVKADNETRTADGRVVCLPDYSVATNYHRRGLLELKEVSAAHASLNQRKELATKLLQSVRRAAANDPQFKGAISETELVAKQVQWEDEQAQIQFKKIRSCLEPSEHETLIKQGIAQYSEYGDGSGLTKAAPNYYYTEQCNNIYWCDVKEF